MSNDSTDKPHHKKTILIGNSMLQQGILQTKKSSNKAYSQQRTCPSTPSPLCSAQLFVLPSKHPALILSYANNIPKLLTQKHTQAHCAWTRRSPYHILSYRACPSPSWGFFSFCYSYLPSVLCSLPFCRLTLICNFVDTPPAQAHFFFFSVGFLVCLSLTHGYIFRLQFAPHSLDLWFISTLLH